MLTPHMGLAIGGMQGTTWRPAHEVAPPRIGTCSGAGADGAIRLTKARGAAHSRRASAHPCSVDNALSIMSSAPTRAMGNLPWVASIGAADAWDRRHPLGGGRTTKLVGAAGQSIGGGGAVASSVGLLKAHLGIAGRRAYVATVAPRAQHQAL